MLDAHQLSRGQIKFIIIHYSVNDNGIASDDNERAFGTLINHLHIRGQLTSGDRNIKTLIVTFYRLRIFQIECL